MQLLFNATNVTIQSQSLLPLSYTLPQIINFYLSIIYGLPSGSFPKNFSLLIPRNFVCNVSTEKQDEFSSYELHCNCTKLLSVGMRLDVTWSINTS